MGTIDETETRKSPMKKKDDLIEKHTEKENHSECQCLFPQSHQNRLKDHEFFPKLRTIKLKKNAENGGPCDQYRYDSKRKTFFEDYLHVTQTQVLIFTFGVASLIFATLFKPRHC